MMRPGRHRGGSRAPGFAIMMLAAQMARVGFDQIPPVTLVAIVGQVVAYLRLLNIRWPSISEVCVSSLNVWYKQEYDRLFLSVLFHSSEWHLYFNMVSFLWKGLKLEPRLGSGYFLYMLVVFTALSNTLYVGIGLAAEHVLHDTSYLGSCAVGFSGVLFALKVVATHMSPRGVTWIMGFIPVSTRHACWAELVLIHIMVPRASFIGHLSGILVGLLYIQGPLKPIMDSVIAPNPSAHNYARPSFNLFRPSRYRNWASRDDGHDTNQPRNSRYEQQQQQQQRRAAQQQQQQDENYTGGMTEEEQLQHALRESLRQDNAHTRAQRPEPTAPPAPPEAAPPPPPGVQPPPYATYGAEGAESQTPYPPNTPPYPTDREGVPPPAYGSIYPDLSRMNDQRGEVRDNRANHDLEEVRRRRLQRFN